MPRAPPAQHRCSHCLREFARAEHLTRHERTHTKEKPFGCSLCNQTFTRRDLLVRHEKRNHSSAERSPSAHSDGTQPPIDQLDQFTNVTTNIASIDSGIKLQAFQADEQVLNSPIPTHSLVWQPNISSFSNQNNASHQFQHDFISDFLMDSSMQDLWNDPTFSQLADYNLQHHVTGALQSPHKSSLLSRPVSPSIQAEQDRHEIPVAQLNRVFTVSEGLRNRFQQVIAARDPSMTIPSSITLSLFMNQYFRTFHRHQPMLHESTLDLDVIPMSLILAICANGAQYSLEAAEARKLYNLSRDFLNVDDSSLHVLQTQMLLLAFSAWSGKLDDLGTALHIQAAMTLRLRRERRLLRNCRDFEWVNWDEWLEYEALKRVTFCLFTVTTLIQIAYDVPSSVSVGPNLKPPCHEACWTATSSMSWQEMTSQHGFESTLSVYEIIHRLSDESLPLPPLTGNFGCHIVILTIMRGILGFSKSTLSIEQGVAASRQSFITTLRRWQEMWENEPGSVLSPKDIRGPILFNSTAILRLSYIRLVMDYSSVRQTFSYTDSVEEIEQAIKSMKPLPRTWEAARAALHSLLALRIPVRLGLKLVARTDFWTWSVQHALSYFECALLLASWLKLVQGTSDVSDDETAVLHLANEVLQHSDLQSGSASLCVASLNLWADLLDTADATVWCVIPKMAKVLRCHANNLQQCEENIAF